MLTKGLFFDGVSSTPQHVAVRLDTQNGNLTISNDGIKLAAWPLSTIESEQSEQVLHIYEYKNSLAYLKIPEVGFHLYLQKYLHENGYLSWYQRLILAGTHVHLAIVAFLMAFIVVGYFYVLPEVAAAAAEMLPETFDDSIGNTVYAEFVTESTIDSTKTAQLNAFASKIRFNNKKKIKYIVVKSTTVNAFALPNGTVVVYTGIVDQMNYYEELAALLGHEVAHINNRHSIKMLCKNLSGYLFISAVLSDVNGIMAVIGDNVNNLQSLSHSRNFEKQADVDGLQTLVNNHINPNGMIDLFKRLQQATKHEMTSLEFFSTHPVTTERLKYISGLIAEKKMDINHQPQLEQLFKQLKAK
jgi:beta-barrel assembly-enhancing protease